jgi:hypothetical protein
MYRSRSRIYSASFTPPASVHPTHIPYPAGRLRTAPPAPILLASTRLSPPPAIFSKCTSGDSTIPRSNVDFSASINACSRSQTNWTASQPENQERLAGQVAHPVPTPMFLAPTRLGVPNKKQDAAEELRQIVATGGKREPGEHVRCVVSVSMLTEGWEPCVASSRWRIGRGPPELSAGRLLRHVEQKGLHLRGRCFLHMRKYVSVGIESKRNARLSQLFRNPLAGTPAASASVAAVWRKS